MRISRKASLAFAELLLAATLWGFGFVATIWALEDVDPFLLTVLRFTLAFFVSIPLLLVNRKWRKEFTTREAARQALLPGIFLGATLIFQTWGLKYTSATNSGFITCLYVVMVPLLEKFLRNAKLPRGHFLCVLGALLGTALMVELKLSTQFNFGDFLTLVCAIGASFQIYFIGLEASQSKSAFVFNTWQSLWALVICAIVFAGIPNFSLPHHIGLRSGFSILFLVFGSTLVAFMLQIKAQKVISSSQSSLFFLLESPFAAVFAMLFLNESLSSTRLLGGALIFISCFVAVRLKSISDKRGRAYS